MSVTFIIPTRNERYTIVNLVRELKKLGEVIVVDDNSTDGTVMLALQAGAEVLINDKHYGKGYSLKRGAMVSTGDKVVFIDANDIPAFQVEKFITGDFDVRIASKFHPESVVDYPLSRRIYSYVYNRIVKFLFGMSVSDTQTGLKAFDGDVIRRIIPLVKNNGFVFDLELLYQLYVRGYEIEERPVIVNKGVYGKVGIWDALSMLIKTIGLWYRL